MLECLALAKKGGGSVSPNPMVGAVLVRRGRVIGRGYHRRFGTPHAEVNAIASVKGPLSNSTLYVNLEPCSYFGKTPPCTDLIIRSKISHVVVGMADPNPRVNGAGIRQLRRAGIRVDVGILREECRKLNETFSKFITESTPFVTLKVAQTLDGKISDPTGTSKWISGPVSLDSVHRLRALSDAVLVGAGTVNADDPLLTVRRVRGRDPVRVLLSGKLSVREDARILTGRTGGPVLLFCDERYADRYRGKLKRLRSRGIDVIPLTARRRVGILPLPEVLRRLASMGIASVLVEGGAATFSSFLDQGAADKILFFIAPKLLGHGTDSFGAITPRSLIKAVKLETLPPGRTGTDTVIEAYVRHERIKAHVHRHH